MAVFGKIKEAYNHLGPGTCKRAIAALRRYGVREFVRRGMSKLRGDVKYETDAGRRLIVTNESYYPPHTKRGFEVRQTVTFSTAPSRDSITKIAVRTVNPDHDQTVRLRLEIADDTRLLASGSTGVVLDDEDTTVHFPMLRGVLGTVLRFRLQMEGGDAGILVNPAKTKDGFTVEGGGSVACRVYGLEGEDPYETWMEYNDPTGDELERERRGTPGTQIAVVVRVSADTSTYAQHLLESLEAQTFSAWHAYLLCSSEAEDMARQLAEQDPSRRTYAVMPEASTSMDALLTYVKEPLVAFAEPSIVLAPHALWTCAEEFRGRKQPGFLYADEDILTEDGRRMEPFFKPDYSPFLELAFNYIGGFFVAHRSLLPGKIQTSTYDLALQCADGAEQICHVPDVLYHAWEGTRSADTLTAADVSAVEAALHRRGIKGAPHFNAELRRVETDYALPNPAPRVSILIPSHDGVDMLRECIASILEKTTYPNYEIVVIENNSKESETFAYYDQIAQDPHVRLLTWNHPFNFAAINNWAAARTDGELLLFLNNDTAVIAPDWLERMAALCVQPNVGAVGAKLLYADDTVQHGGVVMRMMGIASHAHLGVPADSFGSFGRLQEPFDVSGVTGACLMIPREVFDAVGGFDEQYVLAFNDVDLCLKVRELGRTIVFEPRAELYHYESKTRGYEVTPEQQKRFRNEQIIWIRKWLDKYPGDPFYNPNLRYDTWTFDTAPEPRGASAKRVAKPYDDLINADIEL